MHWLFFLLALGAIAVAFAVSKVWILLLLLAGSVASILLWAHGWYLTRVGGTRDDDILTLIDPAELQLLKERAIIRQRAMQQHPSKVSA